jgi:uncharacterized repeat protein (TIGR03803 family)
MKNQRSTLKSVFEIPATARRWSGTKPLLTRLRRLLWAAALVLPIFAARAEVVFTNLYSFTGTNDGAYPRAALVQGSEGYFYGTTYSGGTNGAGTVFKINTDGVLTTLYSFTGGNDGANPKAALVQGRDGFFYGTTGYGGNTNLNGGHGFGTVFKISTNATFAGLHSFDSIHDTNGSPLDGSIPNGLVQGSDGFFYGTTGYGGNTNLNGGQGFGTVFKISTTGALTTLYSFGSIQDTNGNLLDGVLPVAALVQGSDGIFYGTTEFGGTKDDGTVFRISTNGVLNTLYVFDGPDGANPSARLVPGSDGNFYGTTEFGGTNGSGTVFKISTNGFLTTLCSFPKLQGGPPNSSFPVPTGLAQGSDGYLYVTTGFIPARSGASVVFIGFSSIFKLGTNGASTTLYSFSRTFLGPTISAAPDGLVQSSDGSFYGATTHGPGESGFGTIFRLTMVPEFQAMTLTNGTLNLTWSTEAGGTYQLQSSSSLNTPNWTNLGSLVTATNGTLSFTDSITNALQRFYRVSLTP